VTPAANATYNDPGLTKREVGALKKALGDANVVEIPPKMVFEDFSEYSLAGVPATIFMWAGSSRRSSQPRSNPVRHCPGYIRPYGRLTVSRP
jgi:hypothetical protein